MTKQAVIRATGHATADEFFAGDLDQHKIPMDEATGQVRHMAKLAVYERERQRRMARAGAALVVWGD